MITYNGFVDYCKDERGLDDTEIALMLFLIEKDYGSFQQALAAMDISTTNGREEDEEGMDEILNYYEPDYYDSNFYKVGGSYWYIFDDEDEAKETAIELAKSVLPDMSFEAVESYVDSDWFQSEQEESFENYVRDMSDDEVVQECLDKDLIDDSAFEEDEDGNPDYDNCNIPQYQLQDMLIESYVDDAGDPVEWYKDNFGYDGFQEAVSYHNLIDWDAAAEGIVEQDGVEAWIGHDDYEHRYNFDGIEYLIYKD